jgi:hypothetical protein
LYQELSAEGADHPIDVEKAQTDPNTIPGTNIIGTSRD